MKKKKILFYTSGVGLGGVERVILETLKMLDYNKFDVKLALQFGDENLFEDEIPEEVDYRYMLPLDFIEEILEIKSKKKKNFLYKLKYNFMLKKQRKIIEENFKEFSEDRDLLIDFKSADFHKLFSKIDKEKICWYHTSLPTSSAYKKGKEKLRKGLSQYKKIITICDEMKEEFKEEFPEYEEKFLRIYNAFDIEKIRGFSEDESNVLEEEKELFNSGYLLTISRIELKQKDFRTLFKAFKEVAEKENKLKLVVIGDGPHRAEVEEMIKEMNLKNRIILLGKKKNPHPWLKNSKAFILSSNYEGFGLVLVESLIQGKPTISSNCKTGPKEILKNVEAGYLFNVGDYKDLVKKIEEALLVERSIKLEDIERFSKEKIRDDIEKLLLSN